MSGESPTEKWFEMEADGAGGSGPATAAILEHVAEVLREAPDGYQYDWELTVEENQR